MKCAKQYVMEKEQTILKHELELDQLALEKHVEACANAINFCETEIDAKFAELAKNPYPWMEVRYTISDTTDRFGNVHFNTEKSVSYERTVHHRNGTKSKKTDYRLMTDTANIDKETFIKYLNSHCYEVSYYANHCIIIKPAPEC